MIYPPWLKILVPALMAALLFGAGYKVASWKWSGKVEKAVAAKEAAIKERDAAQALETQWRQDIKDIQADLTAKQEAYSALEEQYLEATSRPPEVVVEIREVVKTVTETIVSEDCVDGVGELFTFLASLPERPQ